MRPSRALFIAAAGFISACRAPDVVQVTLTTSSFATSGGNLFNCTTPERPADSQTVNGSGIGCTPSRNADGTFSATPVTVTDQVGCSDGHGAVITVSCAGIPGSADVTGSVTLSLSPSCDQKSEEDASNGDVLTFPDLASGAAQAGSLQACGVFGNICPTSNACAFNAFSATLTVTHVAEKK
jgi:hypothetical protein